MTRIPFDSEAEAEFLDALGQYAAVGKEMGASFLEEFEGILQRIATFPKHGSPHKAGTRRVVMKRFPFSIIYLHEERSTIVALAHHRRRPGYWLKRLNTIR